MAIPVIFLSWLGDIQMGHISVPVRDHPWFWDGSGMVLGYAVPDLQQVHETIWGLPGVYALLLFRPAWNCDYCDLGRVLDNY